jgi:hypothetical protein
MVQIESLHISEGHLIGELVALTRAITNGEVTSAEEVERAMTTLSARAQMSLGEEVWGSGNTSIDCEVQTIRKLLPYVHLGKPGAEARQEIAQIQLYKKHWGPRRIRKMIRKIKEILRENSWDYADIGITKQWIEDSYAECILCEGKRVYLGIMGSPKSQRAKDRGIRDLENFLAKHGLVLDDVRPRPEAAPSE